MQATFEWIRGFWETLFRFVFASNFISPLVVFRFRGTQTLRRMYSRTHYGLQERGDNIYMAQATNNESIGIPIPLSAKANRARIKKIKIKREDNKKRKQTSEQTMS